MHSCFQLCPQLLILPTFHQLFFKAANERHSVQPPPLNMCASPILQTRNGRISMAGVNSGNVERLAQAIAEVTE